MSDRVTGGVDDRGRAVARKCPITPAQRATLDWEADALAAAAHPGVVEVLAVDDDGLTTAYAGTHSLATHPPLTPERTAAVGAALATILADLHAIGVVHGRIDPSHVLVGPDGRPLLCSFSGATFRGRPAPGGPSPVAHGFVDPRLRPGDPIPPTVDVYAIGALLQFLLDRGGGRRLPPAGRRRSIAALARRAMSSEPHRRPTARDIATQLAAERHKALRPAAVAAAVAVALLGTAVLVVLGVARARSVPVEGVVAVTTTSVAAPAGSTTTTAPPPRLVGPNLVAMGHDRYRAGATGDQIVLGDWDCDGVPTVAVLRPSTGEVFVFDTWPTAGRDRTMSPTTVVPGAVRVERGDRGPDGCPALVIGLANGASTEVTG